MKKLIVGIFSLVCIAFTCAYSKENTREEFFFPAFFPRKNNVAIEEPFLAPVQSGELPPAYFNPYPIPQRTSLRSVQRRGIGYRTGYTTLDVQFSPTYRRGRFLPMVDLRGHYLASNSYAANIGFIERYIPYSSCVIYGMNVYYDFRQGCQGNYHQAGVGFEILGTRWDFRINGYAPIGQDAHHHRCVFLYPGGFKAVFKKSEIAFRGFNAEVGYYLLRSGNFIIYGALGPYFLKGGAHESWGGKARLHPQYRDFLGLDLSVSHDHLFKTNYQAEIIFSLPLYSFYSKRRQKGHPCLSDRQIYQPVQRFEIIPLKCHSGWHDNF